METVGGALEWSARELDERLERGEPVFVLDVRHREEFEAASIEGRGALPGLNIPYFEMLEAAESDDLVDAVARYAESSLGGELPRDRPVLAVCAKGGTSELVTQALRRLGYDAANLAGGMAAWGAYYAVRTALAGDGIAIRQLARPARGCLSYLLESGSRALVIDPGRHIRKYRELVSEHGLTIEGVIDTHGHADHVSGGPALARAVGAPYYLHPYDAIHPIDLLPATIAYTPLGDGMRLVVGPMTVEVMWVPGHTLGNTALLVNGRYLLSGDSIFIRSVARPDLGGRAESWAPLHFRSLQRLLTLPDETVVLPGHFSRRDEADDRGVFGTTLGTLRRTNRDLERVGRGAEEFIAGMLSSLPTFPDGYVEIKRVNAGLAHPTEEQAGELELGKNQCALAGA
jgi:glyoxylase-like metal-dependent hydrolase (beta-lactamase superfamily II)/rhodanese-related sulfurtransferase